jgi:hypothetical protein
METDQFPEGDSKKYCIVFSPKEGGFEMRLQKSVKI